MKQILIPLALATSLLAHGPEAWADPVPRLVKELQTNPSEKVRMTAVLSLSKFADPRAVTALTGALCKESEDPKVRGFAAMARGRLRVEAAIPALQKAARAS
ncbi:MAG: HEAT repeat domain-containing protein, partial [Polyangia bacterium]|nr:HEAT repeat domain-containing protein [Polyangia bacterium]